MKCPDCSCVNPDTANFCMECGFFLKKKGNNEQSIIVDGQRKRITALFLDLSGYTSITEKLEPEEVKEITSSIFDATRKVINRYEGFIEHFAGDGVLVLFGVPAAHEDDPLRAANAAIEIHQFVENLSSRFEKKLCAPLAMHSGINTGLAVVDDLNSGTGNLGATGDVINVASRLSDNAESGDILVGPETYRSIKKDLNLESLGTVTFKGKAEPVQVYKIGPGTSPSFHIENGREVFSKMVGRNKELSRLELHVHKVINGEGAVINVSGEAGIGKSRLIAELKRTEVIEKAVLLEGRAISIGQNLSFYPVIDLLKKWVNISGDDTESVMFSKLKNKIGIIDPEGADEILAFVSALMGITTEGSYAKRIQGIEGDALQKLITKNLKDLFIKISSSMPTVLVMEDLHWADISSIELLHNLYLLAEKHRLLFINVFRPGFTEKRRKQLQIAQEKFASYHVEINIQPLDRRDSDKLIGNMLQIRGLSESVKQEIVDRAGGNPFFIEEVVRSLIDEKAIILTEKGFKATEKINEVVIPPTINDVLIARIDRLEENTRELVKVASVIGRNFFYRILKDVADTIGQLDDRLAHLKNIQFIRERIRQQELEYLFKHALAQEAAYATTLLPQRKAIHLQVAQSIEKLFADRLHEFYGMLSMHYTRGENYEKAEHYLVKAGQEAMRSSASDEALNYYQEGLKIYLRFAGNNIDPEKAAMFEKNIAMAFFNKTEWLKAVHHIDEVLHLWEVPALPSRISIFSAFFKNLFLIMTGISRVFRKIRPRSRDNEIFDLCLKKNMAIFIIDNQAFVLLGLNFFNRVCKFDISNSPEAVRSYIGTAAMVSLAGLPNRIAYKLLKIAKENIKKENIHNRISYLAYRTIIDSFSGNFEGSTTHDADTVNEALAKGLFFEVNAYFSYLTFIQCEMGLFAEAFLNITQIDKMISTYDYKIAAFGTHFLATDLYIRMAMVKKALDESKKGYALVYNECEEAVPSQIIFLSLSAEAFVLAGDLKSASETIQKARKIYNTQKVNAPYAASCYLFIRFMFEVESLEAAVIKRDAQAVSEFRASALKRGKTAVKKLRRIALRRTKLYRLMGKYYWLTGKQASALKWWKKSIEIGERLGAKPDLSRTYFEIGKRLLEPGSRHKQINGIAPDQFLDKAKIMFEEMNLKWDLDELKKMSA